MSKPNISTKVDTINVPKSGLQSENTNKKKFDFKFFAPLKLLRYENIYWLWIPMMFFSFLGIIISFLKLEFETPFKDGSFYCTFITIMCPYVLEFFVELKVKKKSNIKQKFTFYKITCTVLAFCHIIFSGLILDKPLAQIMWFEIPYIVISLAITLYIYLVFKMDNHPNYLNDYSDATYIETENENVNEMIIAAAEATRANVNGMEIDI